MGHTGKLVRDRIPEIIRADGKEPVTRVLAPKERLPALIAKLHEEAAELAAASRSDHQAEELIDVYEVLLSIADELGVAWSTVDDLAAAKRRDRGGFAEGRWLSVHTG